MPDAGTRRLSADLDRLGSRRRAALRARLQTVLRTLAPDHEGGEELPTPALLHALEDVLTPVDPSSVWLLLSVLTGCLPGRAEVRTAVRLARLDGPLAAVAAALPRVAPGWPRGDRTWPAVEVVTGRTVVDLHHTADTSLATGIQRVARQVSQRWARDHDVTLVRWTPRLTGLLALDDAEREQALHGTPAPARTDRAQRTVIVPWRCTYLLPELLIEPDRARALEALVTCSRSRTGMIGFDCVPITSAETTGEGMGGGFASMLTAASGMDRVAAISHAAAGEYSGWRTMLAGTGVSGPDVRAVPLPVESEPATPDATRVARDELTVTGLPMVLVVGSHEPRKNHLAVLHAMELLWREGLRFSVVFVGGNAWRSERFTARLAELQSVGRPVESRSGLPDALLWGAYSVAHLVLFPSLNEGFGLPVAEALASGTPVVTSGYGSTREIAESGGALFVDPRDDDDIAAQVRRLLLDHALHADLAARARQRPTRTWDEYAAETWGYFTATDPTDPTGPGGTGSTATDCATGVAAGSMSR